MPGSQHIPFMNFASMHRAVREEVLAMFPDFFDDQRYILGPGVQQFETNYAAFNKVKYVVGVGNGLDALILSLKALGIGPGDEVIVPSNTYIATWLAVSYVGAKPVPVEPRMETYNINPELIAAAITKKTKAIIPVHLYGQACEMDAIMQIASTNNLYVVEDNAQSQGSTWQGQLTGSFGAVNATSFYPGKNLGALGDGGAVTTNDADLAEKVAVLRNYGSKEKYYNTCKGVNSRLDELQARVLDIKLRYLPVWNEERRQIASRYSTLLDGSGLILPITHADATPVFHLFVVRTPHRKQLISQLEANGIGCLIHYPVPPHLQEAYTDLGFRKGDFPIAEEIAATCLSLPLYPGLTEEQVEHVAEVIGRG
jgi:dTDP-4-amino-4,6-dideoxygalactose transaminase